MSFFKAWTTSEELVLGLFLHKARSPDHNFLIVKASAAISVSRSLGHFHIHIEYRHESELINVDCFSWDCSCGMALYTL